MVYNVRFAKGGFQNIQGPSLVVVRATVAESYRALYAQSMQTLHQAVAKCRAKKDKESKDFAEDLCRATDRLHRAEQASLSAWYQQFAIRDALT